MLTLDAQQEAAIEGPVVLPNYLIEVTLDRPYYWATRQQRDFNGNTYQPGFVQLKRITHDSCEFRINNHDYAFTRGAEDGEYLRQPVKVYWAYDAVDAPHYVKPGYWEEGYTVEPDNAGEPGAILRFDGIIFATPGIDEWLTVQCRKTAPRVYPFRKLRPPVANFVPSAGYVLPFDGGIFRIEDER